MNLEEKIKNRDTELQRAYDSLQETKYDILEEIDYLENQITIKENLLIEIKRKIEQCKQRAAEQGYPNLFED